MIGMMIFAMLLQGGAAAYQASQAKEQQRDYQKAQQEAETARNKKVEDLRQQMKDARIRTATDRKARLAARSAAQPQTPAPAPVEKPQIGVTGSYLGGF